ncbi:MAG: phosphohistidine phosphatase SixA [Gammaproteobacteria bacterium]|nr:phosphohistidine phosphatase SixA [Gammaproteobacteria bacterium]
MRLYLVQHGEALSKDVDPERALSDGGRAAAERLASFIAPRRLTISRVLQSGKLRAQQTATILARTLAPDITPEQANGLNPLDDPQSLLRTIASWQEDVLIVGHLPFLAKLVGQMLTGTNDSLVTFEPGTMMCLERDEDRWSVVWVVPPTLLKS